MTYNIYRCIQIQVHLAYLDWAAVSESVSCRQLDCDMVVGGYRLPKGTPLIFSAYLLHHGPYNYTRAEDFWPERFEATPSAASADPREPTGVMYILRIFVLPLSLQIANKHEGITRGSHAAAACAGTLAVTQPSPQLSPAQQHLNLRQKVIIEPVYLACLVVCNLLPVASWHWPRLLILLWVQAS